MEQDLVVRAQNGDQQAFESLTVAMHPRLFRVALGILRDPTHAEDATQMALVDIWKYLPRLREPSRFGGWSYRILVRSCAAHLKATPRWLPEETVQPQVEPRAADPFGAVEDRERLERAFRRLSVDHRAVVVMRVLLDMPQDEVAAALHISVGTVASRLSRALSALRAAIEAEDRRSVALNHAEASER